MKMNPNQILFSNTPLRLLCTAVIGCLALLLPDYKVFADNETREIIPIDKWLFAPEPPQEKSLQPPPPSAKWEPVESPHVFRQSGLPDKSAGWYRQTLTISAADKGRSTYLVLDGAASIKDVFVNGKHIGQHRGAYSRATFNLTPALKFGSDNVLDVRVGNRDDETLGCHSRSTLYFINGGMFRHASLVKTGAVHVSPDLGSTGLYLTPTNISEKNTDLQAKAHLTNPLEKPIEATLRYEVKDPSGAVCSRFETKKTIPAGETIQVNTSAPIADPKLWDVGKPNLYTVHLQVWVGNKLSDEMTERFGIRTIAFRDGKFFLNGREFPVRGVCKHAQTEREWNAISREEMRREWDAMLSMGVNAVRLAHYPHEKFEYDIGDEAGVAIWAENGYAGQTWKGSGNEDKTLTPDGERLNREMVRQNWNHPSILFWSAGNETYPEIVSRYAEIIHEEDATRLVTYAANGKPPVNCDFVAHNTYDGWYSDHFSGFSRMPRNSLVSETGAGSWLTHHVPYGATTWKVDVFEPTEYAQMFTEYRLQTVCRNDIPNRPMFFWWIFREFYDNKFKNNRNTKGLLTMAGQPKDIYYLFKAFLNPKSPMVHLCDRSHFLRSFAPDNGIKAYSNAPELTLILNGEAKETLKNGDYLLDIRNPKNPSQEAAPEMKVENVFFWKTPLKPGRNVLEVTDGKGNSDSMVIYQRTDSSAPADSDSLLQGLQSSNPANPAFHIERPVEAQSPFYNEVDGSSDNTFDRLPQAVEGASWIAAKRLSDPANKTDLAFQINPKTQKADVFVLFSTGEFPVVSLKQPDASAVDAAKAMREALATAGFKKQENKDLLWRNQDCELACAELWSRAARAGESLKIPGQTLDYVVMVKPADKSVPAAKH